MAISRRVFVAGGAVMAGAIMTPRLFAAPPKLRIGACVVGYEDAKLAGLDGVEVRTGDAAERLPIADPAYRQKLKDRMKETGVVTSSIMMGLLNSWPLASDPRGPAWLEQTIDAAKDLGAGVILVAFFGKGDLKSGKEVKKAEVDVVVERLRTAAPRAKDAGVILGIENTLPADVNATILDRIGSPAVKIYYDCYNLANQGYDVPAEIRFLKDRIAIFHFKEGPNYLGEGKMKWEPIVAAIEDINYHGWIVLESSAPSKNAAADAKRNAEYIRKLFAV